MSTPPANDPRLGCCRRGALAILAGLGIWGLCGCQNVHRLTARPLLAPKPKGEHFRVASFNIRCGSAPDGPNRWTMRREAVVSLLADLSCDFVGLQEAEDWQLRELLSGLPDYRAIGRGNGLFARSGEYCAILYRRDRWSIGHDQSDTRWLSYTPSFPGSRGYGARHARIMTWGRFRERATNRLLWCFNTHFDHNSARARRVSARLTLQWMQEAIKHDPPGTAYLLTGDLNANEDSRALAILHSHGKSQPIRLRDTLRTAQGATPKFSTYTGFAPKPIGDPQCPRLDYVLVSPDLQVLDSQVDSRTFNGCLPSDHYPVWADLAFVNKQKSDPA